jgi:hypothetical protein
MSSLFLTVLMVTVISYYKKFLDSVPNITNKITNTDVIQLCQHTHTHTHIHTINLCWLNINLLVVA